MLDGRPSLSPPETAMRLRPLLLAALATIPPLDGAGQVVRGVLLSDVDRAPIVDARVVLLDADGRVRADAQTDTAGWFLLNADAGGWYRLRSSPPGYRAATTPRVEVERGAILDVRFVLSPEVVLLAPLEVRAKSRPLVAGGALQAYRERVQRNVGFQLTREQIAQQNPKAMTDLLRRVPGLRIERDASGGTRVSMTGVRRIIRDCPMRIFVDGQEFRHGPGAIDDMVPVDVEGIEVFRTIAELPPEFSGPDSQCGVIAIWTLRGR
jgi:hypothetical protein